jgi:hypothetical protein
MRKRFMLLWTPAVLGLALMLPGTAAAATLGTIKFVDGYCTGNNTVHSTFKLIKNSGFYASKLTITGIAQQRISGSWKKVATIDTASKQVNTSSKATLQESFTYNPGKNGRFRILAVGRIWNGSTVAAKGQIASGYCE